MNRPSRLSRAFALAAGAAAIVNCSGPPERPRIVSPSWIERDTTVLGNGVVEPARASVATATVSGTLVHLFVRPGAHVAAGQAIAVLQNPQIVADAATSVAAEREARATVDAARADVARAPADRRAAQAQAAAAIGSGRVDVEEQRVAVLNGVQPGQSALGTALAQRAAVDAALTRADVADRAARQKLDIDRDLYADRAIALQTLRTAEDDAGIAAAAARSARDVRAQTYASLTRQVRVLEQRSSAAALTLAAARRTGEAVQAQTDTDRRAKLALADAAASGRAAQADFAAGQRDALTVRAPVTGVVESIARSAVDDSLPLADGEAVAAGTRIATLRLDDGFIVRATIDADDVSGLRTGQTARISGSSLGRRQLSGLVVAIDPRAHLTADGRRVNVVVRLPKRDAALTTAVGVDVAFITRRRRVLTLPASAVAYARGTPAVEIWDGTARRTVAVAVTALDADRIEVHGVDERSLVVAEPYH